MPEALPILCRHAPAITAMARAAPSRACCGKTRKTASPLGENSPEVLTTKTKRTTKSNNNMKKRIFTARLLPLAALFGFVLAFASCANEDAVQKPADANADNDRNLTTFTGGMEPSRTTMNYATGDFFWEAGDHIYVKDDGGAWQKSSNAPTAKTAYFKFYVPGKFGLKNSYKVYYPGKNGSNNQVNISAAQTQTAPATTDHFGASGDCGIADAAPAVGKPGFVFTLDHQAAILVFQPYTDNAALKNCYLTKIEVTSDNDITDTYTLDPTTGKLTGTGTGKQIVLTTKGSGTYANGFPLNTTSASVTINGAYMVIKPGVHKLRVRYWVKDMTTQVEGTITDNLEAFNYAKNTYYKMLAELDVRDYAGDKYYMWDATDGQHYWKGHEWDKSGYSAGEDQPTVDTNLGSAYPRNNSDPRYYNEGGGSGRFDATKSCKDLPNVNELSWYIMKGDPRWDTDELWSTMGHLYKGGMWLKKKSVLIAEGNYSTEKSVDGSTDLRTTWKIYTNNDVKIRSGLPSAADASNYFYLPALGFYGAGYLNGIGRMGLYWSSSGNPKYSYRAPFLDFSKLFIGLNDNGRVAGYRVDGFE